MDINMGICQIRAHHGMCLAFFRGKGYSDEFTEHMGKMKRFLDQNPVVRILAGTDEICGPCPTMRAESVLVRPRPRGMTERCFPSAEFVREASFLAGLCGNGPGESSGCGKERGNLRGLSVELYLQ